MSSLELSGNNNLNVCVPSSCIKTRSLKHHMKPRNGEETPIYLTFTLFSNMLALLDVINMFNL